MRSRVSLKPRKGDENKAAPAGMGARYYDPS